MATVEELLESLEEARKQAEGVPVAVSQAASGAVAGMRATGVRITSEVTSSGVRVRFSENPRSRAQVRLDPGSVAEKASLRLQAVAESAVKGAMSS